MNHRMPVRYAAMLLAVGLAAPATAGKAAEDIGRQMEREYGVVGRDTREGRQVNDQMDRVTERILRGVNMKRTGDNAFQLQSAKVLGGASEKADKMINAFALPDGRIYVTLGLVRAVRDSQYSDDELAFVVGHEVTHVTEKHGSGQQKKAMQAGILAILLGAVTKNKTVGTAAGAGASAYVSSYGRKDEYRADRGGLVAMRRAKFNLDAAVTMLKRLESKGGAQNKTLNGWFGSHPLTGNRVDRIEQMIANIRAGKKVGAGLE